MKYLLVFSSDSPANCFHHSEEVVVVNKISVISFAVKDVTNSCVLVASFQKVCLSVFELRSHLQGFDISTDTCNPTGVKTKRPDIIWMTAHENVGKQ